MVDSYCGKNCENCTVFQDKECPGCHDGPGRSGLLGDCEIADCCRLKGQTSCAPCTRCELFK